MSEYTIEILEEVGSTNAYALEHIDMYSDKTVLRAIKQTNGRGRYNRKWISDDSSNIYATIILKSFNYSTFPFQNLTQYLSIVICNVFEKYFDIVPEIKWPNDILVNGCKISGILAETSLKNNRINAIALGFGINVNLKRETLDSIDQNAISLAVLKNKNFDCSNILNKICDLFFENYEEFIKNGFKYIKNDYIKYIKFFGKNITIREENKQYKAQSVDDDGLLIVLDDFGKEKKIITGDVLC